MCPYGERCYRKNPKHFKEFAHPSKDGKDHVKIKDTEAKKIDTSKLPPCPYGANCYRKNLVHFAEYSHPTRDGATSAEVPAISDGSDTESCHSDAEGNEDEVSVHVDLKHSLIHSDFFFSSVLPAFLSPRPSLLIYLNLILSVSSVIRNLLSSLLSSYIFLPFHQFYFHKSTHSSLPYHLT